MSPHVVDGLELKRVYRCEGDCDRLMATMLALPRHCSNNDEAKDCWYEMELAFTPDVWIEFTWQGHDGSCGSSHLPRKDK